MSVEIATPWVDPSGRVDKTGRVLVRQPTGGGSKPPLGWPAAVRVDLIVSSIHWDLGWLGPPLWHSRAHIRVGLARPRRAMPDRRTDRVRVRGARRRPLHGHYMATVQPAARAP
eukprot:362206-Prymnesium_polylepis.1